MIQKNWKMYNKNWQKDFIEKEHTEYKSYEIKSKSKYTTQKNMEIWKNPYEDKNYVNKYLLESQWKWTQKGETNNNKQQETLTKLQTQGEPKEKIQMVRKMNKLEQTYIKGYLKEQKFVNEKLSKETKNKMSEEAKSKANKMEKPMKSNNRLRKLSRIRLHVGEYITTFKRTIFEQREWFQVRKIYNQTTGTKNNLFQYLKTLCKKIYAPNEFSNEKTIKAYINRCERENKIETWEKGNINNEEKIKWEELKQIQEQEQKNKKAEEENKGKRSAEEGKIKKEEKQEIKELKNEIKKWMEKREKAKQISKQEGNIETKKEKDQEKNKNKNTKTQQDMSTWKKQEKRNEINKSAIELSNEKKKIYWKSKTTEQTGIIETRINQGIEKKEENGIEGEIWKEKRVENQVKEEEGKKTSQEEIIKYWNYVLKEMNKKEEEKRKENNKETNKEKTKNKIWEEQGGNEQEPEEKKKYINTWYIPTKKTNLIPSNYLKIIYNKKTQQENNIENQPNETSSAENVKWKTTWNIKKETENKSENWMIHTMDENITTNNQVKMEERKEEKYIPITSIIVGINRTINKKAIDFMLTTRHTYTSIFGLKNYWQYIYNQYYTNPKKTNWKDLANKKENTEEKKSSSVIMTSKEKKKENTTKILNTDKQVQEIKARYYWKMIIPNNKTKKSINGATVTRVLPKQKNLNQQNESKNKNEWESGKESINLKEQGNTIQTKTLNWIDKGPKSQGENIGNQVEGKEKEQKVNQGEYTKQLKQVITLNKYKKKYKEERNESENKSIKIKINEIGATSEAKGNQEQAYIMNQKRNKVNLIQTDITWYNSLNLMTC